MLSAGGNDNRRGDGVDKAREDRDKANAKTEESSPVHSVPVMIHSMGAVQFWDVDFAFLYNPIFSNHDRGNRSKPDLRS